MCRETVDHLHLLGSSGAQFDDTPDQGCPHFPLPLGAKLHDLLLALNQPCIYPYARGRDTTRVIGHATVVEGEPDDFIQIMDEVEGLRELDLMLEGGITPKLNAGTGLSDIVLQLASKLDGDHDPWTHLPVAGLSEELPDEKDNDPTTNHGDIGDQEDGDDDTDCMSHIAVLGNEDEEHKEVAQDEAQDEEADQNAGL